MTPAGVKGQREFLEGGASKETFEDRGRVFTSGLSSHLDQLDFLKQD